MVNVILYTRVSTDEQADGMSLEAQERYLRAYCSNHDYNIVGDEQPYKEDHSAKHITGCLMLSIRKSIDYKGKKIKNPQIFLRISTGYPEPGSNRHILSDIGV